MTKEQASLLIALNIVQCGYLFLLMLVTVYVVGRK
jgi:hypothetical protein